MWVFQGKIVVPWSPAWFSYCFPCSIAESCPCPKALHCPFLRPPGSCWSRSYVRALWMVCLLPWALALPNRMNSKFEVIPAAMSDGAKRRLTSDGEFDEKLPVPRRPRPAFLMELLQRQRGARPWSSPEGTQGPDELCRAGQVFPLRFMWLCTWLITQKDRSDLTAPVPDLVSYLVRQLIQGLFRRQHHCPKAWFVSEHPWDVPAGLTF